MARRWRILAFAVLLASYFLFFNLGSLRVHFALDDLGNMGHYFRLGPWRLILSQFLPWRGDYRPMGGVFYLPVFHFAGLDPLPFQAVLLLLLAANVFWTYRLARLLGCEELVAGLAALAVCYHAGLGNLYYNAAFIYDVLCWFFYLAAFTYYLGIRRRGGLLSARQTAVFLALFLCALNSKEMAVTLPVMVVAYEWIYHRPAGWNRADLAAWLRGPARVALFAAALDALDVYGKLFGPDPLAAGEGYHPVFTLHRVRAFQKLAFEDLFLSWGSSPGWGGILLLFALLAYLAWRRADRPWLRFLFWYLLVAPLPLEFLVGKSQACLALLMVGWALFAATVLVDVARAAARVLVREPLFRRAGTRGLTAILLTACLFVWARQNLHFQRTRVKPAMAALGADNWYVVQQLRALKPRVRPGDRVAFLDDPFHSWDMLFIASLWLHDRSIDIHVWRNGPLTPQELAQMNAVFTFQNGKLVQVR